MAARTPAASGCAGLYGKPRLLQPRLPGRDQCLHRSERWFAAGRPLQIDDVRIACHKRTETLLAIMAERDKSHPLEPSLGAGFRSYWFFIIRIINLIKVLR